MINNDNIKQLYSFDEIVMIHTGSFKMEYSIYLLFLKYAMSEKINANTPEKLMALIDLQNSTHNVIDSVALNAYLKATFSEYDDKFSFTGALFDVYERIGFDNAKVWNALWSINSIESKCLSDFITYKIVSGGRMTMESLTNPSIAKLGVTLLNPKSGEVCYDPFSGMGTILSSFPNDVILYGNELNPTSVIISQIRMIVEKKNAILSCGDSFIINNKNIADVVFSDAPLAGVLLDYESIYKEYPEITPSKEVNIASVVCALESLKDDGRGILHVPTGVLFRETKNYRTLRKYLLSNNFIEAVIELPSVCYGTMVKTALLVISKQKKDESVMFINAEQYSVKEKNVNYITDEGIKNIEDIIKNKKVIKNISAVRDYRDLLVAEEPLMVNRFIEIENLKEYRNINEINKEIDEVWSELLKNMGGTN